jgi:hypothetical protein
VALLKLPTLLYHFATPADETISFSPERCRILSVPENVMESTVRPTQQASGGRVQKFLFFIEIKKT